MLPHFIIYCIGFLFSLVLTLAIMPRLIRYLHKIKFGQTEREEGLESQSPKREHLRWVDWPLFLYQ